MKPTDEDIADLDQVDIAALRLAIDLTLADDPPDGGRAEQIRDMMTDGQHCWREIAESCAYSQQMVRLALYPAQSPPCWVITAAEADAILLRGPIPAADGSTVDTSDCDVARLTKRMLKAGVSPYHPNPIGAIAAAKKLRAS